MQTWPLSVLHSIWEVPFKGWYLIGTLLYETCPPTLQTFLCVRSYMSCAVLDFLEHRKHGYKLLAMLPLLGCSQLYVMLHKIHWTCSKWLKGSLVVWLGNSIIWQPCLAWASTAIILIQATWAFHVAQQQLMKWAGKGRWVGTWIISFLRKFSYYCGWEWDLFERLERYTFNVRVQPQMMKETPKSQSNYNQSNW